MRRARVPLTVVVLAAGQGTRMRSKTIKLLPPVAGRPMVTWTIDAVSALRPSRIVTVVGFQADRVRKTLRDATCLPTTPIWWSELEAESVLLKVIFGLRVLSMADGCALGSIKTIHSLTLPLLSHSLTHALTHSLSHSPFRCPSDPADRFAVMEISPLLSYDGEDLAQRVDGKVFDLPTHLT